MKIEVVYEDSEIVVIEKPSGVVSNRAETVKSETAQDWNSHRIENLELSIRSKDENERYFGERAGLVHRLDKETSGLMVLAKTPEAFLELLRQFREREVRKEYLALTHGLWQVKEGVIELPVGRMRQNRKMMGVREDGRESVTSYRVEAEYRSWQFPPELKVNDKGYSGFSLVRFTPKTGRMHQIRVHAKQMGHPLVGDEVYAGRKRSREDRKWSRRVMLHASQLELTHPSTGKRMKWGSEGEVGEVAKQYLHIKE